MIPASTSGSQSSPPVEASTRVRWDWPEGSAAREWEKYCERRGISPWPPANEEEERALQAYFERRPIITPEGPSQGKEGAPSREGD